MKNYYLSISLFQTNMIKIFDTLLFSAFFILLISCSGSVNNSQHIMPYSYLSSEYEDRSFSNVAMDIIATNRKPQYNTGLDSNTISSMINFDESFRKYFPEGIKKFSSITKVGWIFYDPVFDTVIVEYSAKTKDGRDYFTSLSDSLSFFQRQSNSDFLFLFNNMTISQSSPRQSNKNSANTEDYETIINAGYSIWNCKNSDLVVQDTVTTRMKFKNLVGKWPYRATVLKLAYDIFEKLPMFEK